MSPNKASKLEEAFLKETNEKIVLIPKNFFEINIKLPFSYGERRISNTSTSFAHAKGSSTCIRYVGSAGPPIANHSNYKRDLQASKAYWLLRTRLERNLLEVKILEN